MREDFEATLVGYEIFEMVLNKNADALFGIRYTVEAFLQLFHDGGEGIFLD